MIQKAKRVIGFVLLLMATVLGLLIGVIGKIAVMLGIAETDENDSIQINSSWFLK